jgi:hypothetical protein
MHEACGRPRESTFGLATPSEIGASGIHVGEPTRRGRAMRVPFSHGEHGVHGGSLEGEPGERAWRKPGGSRSPRPSRRRELHPLASVRRRTSCPSERIGAGDVHLGDTCPTGVPPCPPRAPCEKPAPRRAPIVWAPTTSRAHTISRRAKIAMTSDNGLTRDAFVLDSSMGSAGKGRNGWQ